MQKHRGNVAAFQGVHIEKKELGNSSHDASHTRCLGARWHVAREGSNKLAAMCQGGNSVVVGAVGRQSSSGHHRELAKGEGERKAR